MSQSLQAVYIIAFALATVGCLWGAYQAIRLDDSLIRYALATFLTLSGVWAATTTATFFSLPLPVLSALYTVGLVPGLAVVVAWLWFCSAYAGHPYHYSRRLQLIALGAVVGLSVLKLTNPVHGQYFQPGLATEPFTHFSPDLGPLYWLIAALAYIGAGVGLYWLFEVYFTSDNNTLGPVVLTVLLALPMVPRVLALLWPETVLLVFYEPLGAAIFAVGVLTVAREPFLAVRTPARRQLADQLTDLVLVVDHHGRLADFNQSAAEVFPDLERVLGEPLETHVSVVSDVRNEEVVTIERDAMERHFSVTISPLTIHSKIVGQAIVLSDVTELETNRRALEQQVEHVDAFTEAIAHELRNPLAVILGEAQMLGDRQATTDQERAATIEESALRIEEVIDDLLGVINHSRPITDPKRLTLADILTEAWGTSETGQVAFRCEVEGTVHGEPVRCLLLFQYLFEAHAERGASTVRARPAGGEELVIESDGEPFGVSDPSRLLTYGQETDERVPVTLANARMLASLHGWTLEIDDSDSGVRFVIGGIDVSSTAAPCSD